MLKLKFLFFVFLLSLLARAQTRVPILVVDQDSIPIPYATIIMNTDYGNISDSLGKFNHLIYHYMEEKYKIYAAGYDPVFTTSTSLKKDSVVVLNKTKADFQPFGLQLDRTFYTGKCKKVEEKINTSTSNLEYFTHLNAKELVGKKLMQLGVFVGFHGNPKLPIRVNVYDGVEKYNPGNLLNLEDVFIWPTEELKEYSIDLNQFGIVIPEGGVLIGLEVVNAGYYKQFFKPVYHPIFGWCKKNYFPFYVRNPSVKMSYPIIDKGGLYMRVVLGD